MGAAPRARPSTSMVACGLARMRRWAGAVSSPAELPVGLAVVVAVVVVVAVAVVVVVAVAVALEGVVGVGIAVAADVAGPAGGSLERKARDPAIAANTSTPPAAATTADRPPPALL